MNNDGTISHRAEIAPWSRADGCVLFFLILATLLAFGRGAGHDFINYDDDQYVRQNQHVLRGLTQENVTWAFTTSEMGNWHPFTWLSLQLDAQLFGTEPAGFHLTNILLHLANTLLLFATLRRLKLGRWPGAVVAALFALHPLHVESVAWISERKDVLSTFFGMVALWCYAHYAPRPRLIWYGTLTAAFILSLLAKPMLVTLPAVFLLLDYWPLQRIGGWKTPSSAYDSPRENRPGRVIGEKLPLFLVAGIAGAIAMAAQDRQQAIQSWEEFPLGVRVGNALVSYVTYLDKTLMPYDLAPFYPHPGISLPLWQPMAAGFFLLMVTAIFLKCGGNRPYLIVGWLWFLITLAPVIGLVQVGIQARADRYTYFPLIGIFMALSVGFWEPTGFNRLARRLQLAGGSALVGVLFILCFIQVGYWRNSVSLWRHAILAVPHNFLANYNLARALYDRGETSESFRYFSEVIRIKPDFGEAYYNLGVILDQGGQPQEALRYFQQGAIADPNNFDLQYSLGVVYARQSDLVEAENHLRAALAIRPRSAAAHHNLGLALAEQGKTAEALNQYQAALDINPEYALAHQNLGQLWLDTGKVDKAIAELSQAVTLAPSELTANHLLGIALLLSAKPDLAVAALRRASAILPTSALIQADLAHALMCQGETKEAALAFQDAFRRDPFWAQAVNNGAWQLATRTKATSRQIQEALRMARQICEATDFRDADYLDTLATAAAAASLFCQAQERARWAVTMAKKTGHSEWVKPLEDRLQMFKQNKLFHQSSPSPRKWPNS